MKGHTSLFAVVVFGAALNTKSSICHLTRAEIMLSLKDRESKHRRCNSDSQRDVITVWGDRERAQRQTSSREKG